ncbi:MAG: type II toxin-antitoxin system RelE/ParE family toxin [Acidobacteriota bacterium]
MKRLVLSPTARSDLMNIRVYIASENKPAANRVIREIKARFKTLLSFPESGRRRGELKKGLRSLPVKKYVVFYFVIKDGVKIVRVLHSAQDIESIFNE